MTTSKQDQNFILEIMPSSTLKDAIDWISRNLNPEEVFDKDALEEWAIDNGFKKMEEEE